MPKRPLRLGTPWMPAPALAGHRVCAASTSRLISPPRTPAIHHDAPATTSFAPCDACCWLVISRASSRPGCLPPRARAEAAWSLSAAGGPELWLRWHAAPAWQPTNGRDRTKKKKKIKKIKKKKNWWWLAAQAHTWLLVISPVDHIERDCERYGTTVQTLRKEKP